MLVLEGGVNAKEWKDRARWYAEHLSDDEDEDNVLDAAEALTSLAIMLTGKGCTACQGKGRRAYGSTATWRGGIGGQAITADVCDKCWGSGNTEQPGTDLRRLRNQQRNMAAMRELCARIITNNVQRADILRAFDTGWIQP